MPIYRALEDFGKLLPAETKVLARMAEDEPVVIAPTAEIGGSVPALGDAAHKIRAEFVAFLARGGGEDAELPPQGLHIMGAWIAGTLDLRGPAIDRDLGLFACRFDAPPNLMSARLANLYLDGAHFPGLDADRLEAKGGVFLRQTVVEGEARFLGARLGGNLDCNDARFSRVDENALSADRLEAKGGVFLRHAVVEGEARFLGARLGGNLDCNGARFLRRNGNALNADGLEAKGGVILLQAVVEGDARFVGARLGGDLAGDGARFSRLDGNALSADRLEANGGVFLRHATVEGEARFAGGRVGGNFTCIGTRFANAGRVALRLEGARVVGALLLRNDVHLRGRLDMSDAGFGHINDDRASWPGPGDLILDRCRYEAFIGGPVDARSRLDWLALQDPARFGHDFWPQTYEQLARVFREMGHAADARAVLIEKERLQRRAQRAKMGRFSRALYWLRDGVLGATIRYGVQPLWAFAWLAGFMLLGLGMFHDAERFDALKPNQVFSARSDEWVACAAPSGAAVEAYAGAPVPQGARTQDETRLACFAGTAQGADYPRFSAFAYSIDTLFPLVDLEMQEYWIPDETADWAYARATRWYLWAHIAAGWALSLLAVAGFSGLVKSD